MLLVAIIAVPFIGGFLAILFPANARNAEAYLAGLVAVIALALVVATYLHVTKGGVVQYNAAWIPELGLEFSLRMVASPG
jgi:multicomponent K+:H+ antiporter subunit A